MSGSVLANGEALVLAPGGHRPATLLRHVPAGGKLKFDENKKIVFVDDKTGAVTQYQEPSAEALAWLAKKKDTPPVPTVGDGWQAFVDSNVSAIGDFKHTYTVPHAPVADDNQTLFYFGYTADAHTGMATLFQPVLQWGSSAAGGGAYWAIACWYLYSGTLYYTSVTDVSVGDNLTGEVSLDFFRGDVYVTITFEGFRSSPSLTTPAYTYPDQVPAQTYVGFSLEAYGLSSTYDLSADAVTLSVSTLTDTSGGGLTTSWSDNNWNSGVTATYNNNDNPGAELTIHPPS